MANDARTVPTGPAADEGGGDIAARVVRLLEVVQHYAVLDFGPTAPVGDAGDDLDALAAGINMLGEELEGWNQDFSQRVDEQTTMLHTSLDLLHRFNTQMSKLAELSSLLQRIDDRQDAFALLDRFVPEIFARTSGVVYASGPRPGHVEATTRWGPHRTQFPSTVPSDGCCALPHGRAHDEHDRGVVHCEHLAPGLPGCALCVPLVARGESFGLLSLHADTHHADRTPDRQVAGTSGRRSTDERLALMVSEHFALAVTNVELRNQLRTQSIRDGLTGLYNRRYLDDALPRELSRAERNDTPVSMLMLDIDHFKDLNDTHGHAAGDAVLTGVAAVLLEDVRSEDITCRYGGDEFAVIMAGLDQTGAVERAERILDAILSHDFTWNDRTIEPLTVSIGVATSPQQGDAADLLRAADRALYRAKDGGRRRVTSAT